MTTLTGLITSSRNLLNDLTATYTFSDAQITDFINAAIADLNQYFPRRMKDTLSTTAGVHTLDGEINWLAVLQVEYPISQTPPKYLLRLARSDPRFWGSNDYYDVVIPHDAGSLNPPQITLSATPSGVAIVNVELLVEHAALSSPSGSTTVLDRHVPLIPLFVRWKCLQNLAVREEVNPDIVKPMVSHVELNARRAEASYRDALKAATNTEGESGYSAGWRMDKYDQLL